MSPIECHRPAGETHKGAQRMDFGRVALMHSLCSACLAGDSRLGRCDKTMPSEVEAAAACIITIANHRGAQTRLRQARFITEHHVLGEYRIFRFEHQSGALSFTSCSGAPF
jgi:hypothetical protein